MESAEKHEQGTGPLGIFATKSSREHLEQNPDQHKTDATSNF